VFFDLFFEAEHFSAILIAYGTYGHSQKCVWGEWWNSRQKAESGEEVLGKGEASWRVWGAL